MLHGVVTFEEKCQNLQTLVMSYQVVRSTKNKSD